MTAIRLSSFSPADRKAAQRLRDAMNESPRALIDALPHAREGAWFVNVYASMFDSRPCERVMFSTEQAGERAIQWAHEQVKRD